MDNQKALNIMWQAASAAYLDMKNNELLRNAYIHLAGAIGKDNDKPVEADTEPQE